MVSRRKKARKILITTPYPKPEETAKLFGLSKKQVQQIKRRVDKVMGKKKKTRRR